MARAACVAVFTLALGASPALGVNNYGLDFVTIGDPGNPAIQAGPTRPIGAVDYEYRLTRTEITSAQQFEFLQAYDPFMQQQDRRLWGDVNWVLGEWNLAPGDGDKAARMSPRLWARYANWLHNDKALTQDAFESGAYDASTFGDIRDEDGRLIGITDQMTRSKGARFWIPSLDEWTKGGYWDPNRFGEGEGGYWQFPNSSDQPSIQDIPGVQEGDTNTGTGRRVDVGSYPDTQTPWGLLDYSGGEFEVGERINSRNYLQLGSQWGGDSPLFADVLGQRFVTGATSPIGLRLASAVPSPGASVFLVGIAGAFVPRRRHAPALAVVAAAGAFALAAPAQGVPDYGLDFVTIGDPGNPDIPPDQLHPLIQLPFGAVDYEYRLTRTELTYTQQLEFLNAYAPHYADDGNPLRSWGDITFTGFSGGDATWRLRDGAENRPGEMSPRLWMRYANWLHNDKALTRDAFNIGAYDTSTFGEDDDGELTDQVTRSEGARFWIPSIDEWIKGGYWDPNRYGEGEGGYWLYPNSSDTPSVPGFPDEGGETNAGFGDFPLDVGSYPETQSPWGLLDYSGGGHFEAAERLSSTGFYLSLGSRPGISDPEDERLGWLFGFGANSAISFRLASDVPSPSALAPLAFMFTLRRRTRHVSARG